MLGIANSASLERGRSLAYRYAPQIHAGLRRGAVLALSSQMLRGGRIRLLPSRMLSLHRTGNPSMSLLHDSGNNFTRSALTAALTLLAILALVPRLALASLESNEQNGADAPWPSTPMPSDSEVAEVVVTAQKRSERLQDVPVPVSAVNADSLVTTQQFGLKDYYSSIPGLAYASNGTDLSTLSIRGLNTGDRVNPTVGIVVDDVPYGSSTSLGGGTAVPEFDPSDLYRVEVLRGPQGTLYGASSLGGLIKYVTADPSTAAVTGHVLAGLSSIYHGAEPGYNAQGSINVPATESLAVLGSAFTHRDAGYIDNPLRGVRGVNEVDVSGARLSALWKPTNAYSLKLSALYHRSKSAGADHANPQFGVKQLQQDDLPGTGAFDRSYQAYSATLTAKIARADLIAITGYSIDRLTGTVDYDAGLGFLDALTEPVFGIPNGSTGVILPERNETRKFTQEVRLTTPLGNWIDWLIGGFYTHERSPFTQIIDSADPTAGTRLGEWANLSWVVTYAEYAAFTDFSLRLADPFRIQLGARASHIRQTYTETDSGPFVPMFEGFASPLLWPEVGTNDHAVTYLITPQWTISPHAMVYARLASGYRPGGPNPTASLLNLPASFKPDKTDNYEIGFKGSLPDRSVEIDASVYYIDWKDIQLSFIEPSTGFAFNANGSRARSRGVEISTTFRPARGLTIAPWVSLNDAALTEPFPAASAVYGGAGDRLPQAARVSGNLSLDEEFPLGPYRNGFVGCSISYVGDRKGNFRPPPLTDNPRQDYPAYVKSDLRAGVRQHAWTFSVFVNNVTDNRGILYGGLGTAPNPLQFNYIQPRTVGLSVSRSFEGRGLNDDRTP